MFELIDFRRVPTVRLEDSGRIVDDVDAPDSERPSPVRLVEFDIDGADPRNGVLASGGRAWIEVMRSGQVVGVIEREVGPGGLSPGDVADLVLEYRAIEVADLAGVSNEGLPMISVVIPTLYHRVDLLERAVRSVAACDYPSFEVIVVDNRRQDVEPIPHFEGLENVRVEIERFPGASAARNRGATLSRGQIVAFTDDDVEVDPKWLRALGVAFATDPGLDAVGGMVRPAELDTEAQLWFEEFFGGFTRNFAPQRWSVALVGDSDPLFPYAAGHFGAGNNMAVRRSVLERAGGFDVRLGAGTIARGAEDLKVFIDVLLDGGTVAFVPSALVRHSHRRTPREFREQVFGYGVGLAALYCALVVEDPRHLARILRRLPRGLQMFFFPSTPRSLSAEPTYPRSTAWVHALGMAYGPLAYARSALAVRRTRRRLAVETR